MFGLYSRYGFVGLVRLCLDVVVTRLFFPQCRLIRSPFYLRGRAHIELGRGMTTGVGVRIDAFGESGKTVIWIGHNVQLNDCVHIGAISHISIGDDVLIASRVFITDHNHGGFRGTESQSSTQIPPANRPLVSSPVFVGDRVWLGEGVCVMPGVTIGDGAVIGAGAVVTKDVPSNSLAVGNPARVIKIYDLDLCEWRPVGR